MPEVLNSNDLLRAAEVGGGLFLALQILGSVRCELDQLTSLVEVGMAEAEEVRALNPDRLDRALNVGRAIIDLLEANTRRLGLVETHLMRRQVRQSLPLFGDPIDGPPPSAVH